MTVVDNLYSCCRAVTVALPRCGVTYDIGWWKITIVEPPRRIMEPVFYGRSSTQEDAGSPVGAMHTTLMPRRNLEMRAHCNHMFRRVHSVLTVKGGLRTRGRPYWRATWCVSFSCCGSLHIASINRQRTRQQRCPLPVGVLYLSCFLTLNAPATVIAGR